ncbi:hypothetical protein [Methylacidimicrobium sp. AP8]|uniref:hypothetical protein n=1 Tax=Methylacidimicrobium sp. AP8 TaxID=2730359 RepID=UPI001F38D79E|nr:hypothetical protein [Methylacidimicrobium sp. AP8]
MVWFLLSQPKSSEQGSFPLTFPARNPSPWGLPWNPEGLKAGFGVAFLWATAIAFFACPCRSRADPVFYPGEEIAAQDLVESMNDQEPGTSWFDKWHRMTAETKERQTNWMTPLVTTTSRLEQRIRYDVYDETLGNGNKKYDFGAGKGVSLIVMPTDQFTFSLPNYIYEPGVAASTGWRGEVLQWRHRIMASPENQKNYVFSVQLAALSPTGDIPSVENHWVWTPMLLFGKGWGNFNFIVNLGTQWADGDNSKLSSPIIWNAAFEYRIGRFTPCVEFNSQSSVTPYLVFGPPGLFVTPELLIGRFTLKEDLRYYFGIGYQIALEHSTIEEKYANALIAKFHLLF